MTYACVHVKRMLFFISSKIVILFKLYLSCSIKLWMHLGSWRNLDDKVTPKTESIFFYSQNYNKKT